jgi:hypothetical protein
MSTPASACLDGALSSDLETFMLDGGIPQRNELFARPDGEEAELLIAAARAVAQRFFAVCEKTEKVNYDDARGSEPRIRGTRFGGHLTECGIMLACHSYLLVGVLTPWGPWSFASNGMQPCAFQFIPHPVFSAGLELGEALQLDAGSMLHPVLAVDGVRLPVPRPYRLEGGWAEADEVLGPEWRKFSPTPAPSTA